MTVPSSVEIKPVSNDAEKRRITRAVLDALPDWFGIESAKDEYVQTVAPMPFWAAYDGEAAVGFLALKETSDFAADLYVLGVLPDYHRAGIGKRLFDAAYSWCKARKIEFLQVKTLSDEVQNPAYLKTYNFYRALGFKPLEVLPTLWDEHNPCLILIMHIA